jgi:FkbM family methyltransferase
MLLALARGLDAIGMRPLVARVATLAYPGQRFGVDKAGRWLNQQAECTIVSRDLHTQRFAEFSAWARHHWLYRYTPKPGDIVVDVGAGLGEEAVVFSRLVGPEGHVYSIEAHPDTFACLEQTVARSGLRNVTPIHCALADKDGEALIGDAGYLGNSILRDGQIAVPQRSLASLAEELGIDRIDFLRMNIEGAEKLAVRGLGRVEIANLCISCHDFCGLPSKAEVRAALEGLGYKVTTREAEPDAPWTGDYLYGRQAP